MEPGQGMSKVSRGSAQNATRGPKIAHDLDMGQSVLRGRMTGG